MTGVAEIRETLNDKLIGDLEGVLKNDARLGFGNEEGLIGLNGISSKTSEEMRATFFSDS